MLCWVREMKEIKQTSNKNLTDKKDNGILFSHKEK
jgi:hypothetical protein